MATEDADVSDSGQLSGDESADSQSAEGASSSGAAPGGADAGARVGSYTWREFMQEHGHEDDLAALYPSVEDTSAIQAVSAAATPSGDDWETVSFDPEAYLGFHPDEIEARIGEAASGSAEDLFHAYRRRVNPDETHVRKGWYSWEEFKAEYHYDENGNPPEGSSFDASEYLGFDPEDTEGVFGAAGDAGEALAAIVDERTVTTLDQLSQSDLNSINSVDEADVEAFDEDAFFSDEYGNTTLVNRYDLEKAVPPEKKVHFREEDRYWVNKPYSFITIFHSVKENEKKYYAIEPYTNEIEEDLRDFLTGKLRTSIKYSDDDVVVEGTQGDRARVIEREARRLLNRYDLYSGPIETVGEDDAGDDGLLASLGLDGLLGDGDDGGGTSPEANQLEGLEARPEPVVLGEDPTSLSESQVEKLLYYFKRDFIGYERIDPIKHDTVNVEDISCNGYNMPVFVYHSDYEQIITNIYHGDDELDDFVVKLAQRSGKGISKRNPQVDATLPDGSRSQLTLGGEVSDHGTNYTIRQFQEVPFTPVDQIAWNTFSLDEMAFLWLCIENHKSMIIAGGTATGKTTLLNAVSLFIPSNAKIVSIEDTREVELPQRNWIASVTRPSFGEDDTGDVDEFDLLEAALRQRPDYIVMGEVRGEEGRDLFQVMSTGHTSYSTFHADSVGEVLKRFTTDPINVSKTMFTALDLVAIQTRTRVDGHKVVRNKNLTEINHYDAENDEINVQDVYQWQAETDEFLKMGESNTLEEIMFDRGWTHDRLQQELFKREVILAYLIENNLNTYTQVAATIQAFINDPKTILTLIANEQLKASLEDLREMESVMIDVDPKKEELAPRPEPGDETEKLCLDILDRAEDSLFDEYRGEDAMGLASAIDDIGGEPDRLELPEEDDEDIEFSGELSEDAFQSDDLEMESDADQPMAGGEETPALDAQPAADSESGETGTPSGKASTADSEAVVEASTDDDSPGWLFGDEAEGEQQAETADEDDLTFGEGGAAAGDEPDGTAAGDEPDGAAFGGGGTEPDDGGDGGFAFESEDAGTGSDDAGADAEETGGMAFGDEGTPSDDADPAAETDEGGFAFDEGGDGDADSASDDGDEGGFAFDDGDGSADGSNDDSADGSDDDGFAFEGEDGDAGTDAEESDDGFAFGDDEESDGDSDEEDSSGGLAFGTDGGRPAGEGDDE